MVVHAFCCLRLGWQGRKLGHWRCVWAYVWCGRKDATSLQSRRDCSVCVLEQQ